MKNQTQSLYEQLGGTYCEENGYLIPDVELPEQKEIGRFGRQHLEFLKRYHKGKYTTLLTEGILNEYLAGIDEQAQKMQYTLIAQLAEQQGITEQLKAENQLAWVGAMNNIRASVNEIINETLIYHV